MTKSTRRPERISPRAISELIDNLTELMFFAGHQNGDVGLAIIERMERPIKHLCMEAGIPEVYERFRMRVREVIPASRTMRERTTEQLLEIDPPKPRRPS